MGLLSRLFGGSSSPPADRRKGASQPTARNYHWDSRRELESTRYGNKKYSWNAPNPGDRLDYEQIREQARAIYSDSTIAHSIVERLIDNVINTGLTWESAPDWSLIPVGPRTEENRSTWTRRTESLFRMWANARECTVEGELTFSQLQRLVYRLLMVDGEVTAILRYMNDPKRSNPLSVQLIRADQIRSPWDDADLTAIRDRGGVIRDGIEFDKNNRKIAIWVADGDELFDQPKRIPFYGPRSGRRFVIHHSNVETAGQARGLPELESLAYELSRLTDYDIAELEGAVSQGAWIGETVADTDAVPGRGPKIKPNMTAQSTEEVLTGSEIDKVELPGSKMALYRHNNAPGYQTKWFTPTRPNPNYAAFVEAFENRLAGALGMPRSVLLQQFNASYSAARGEIKFFWNTVDRRRDDFVSGFLGPIYEAWFTEHVRAAEIEAPGYFDRITHRAWLAGHWDGISMPQIDPLKEVNAIEKRLALGHTTGEREAKKHNGSDFRANVERLATENKQLAEARSAIQAMENPSPAAQPPAESEEDEEESANE